MAVGVNAAERPGVAPELDFSIEGAATAPYAAQPTIALTLRIRGGEEARIDSLLLDVQLRIAARQRSYGSAEEERLIDLFGHTEQWGASLQSLLWMNTTLFVPRFIGSTAVDLPVPCTYDFEVTAARYLAALEDGQVPLEVLFSGTVFHRGQDGALQIARLPLDREATFGLPVRLWRDTMDRYFPGSAWLRLGRESFDRLYAYRSREALPSWDAAIDSLLQERDR